MSEAHSAARDVSSPVPLEGHHDLSQFACGEPLIDAWLRDTAGTAEGRTARTYVVCQGAVVVGYHCIATGSVERKGLPKTVRHGNSERVPIAIIGRLGVTGHLKGRGLGEDLVRDALKRVAQAAEIIGIRGVVVHAIDDRVAAYYQRLGFQASPLDPRTLFMSLETVRAAL